jgi:hypothetical protein
VAAFADKLEASIHSFVNAVPTFMDSALETLVKSLKNQKQNQHLAEFCENETKENNKLSSTDSDS